MRLFVPLTKTEFDALREIARTERRRPQDQAAAIIAQSLQIIPQQYTSKHDARTEPVMPTEYEEAERVAV
ncbi:MAG: hypothetical protein M3Q50_12930 [Chloroflexota bacterium]|nr:hypothetical protein [Chloroflexota bacterium]